MIFAHEADLWTVRSPGLRIVLNGGGVTIKPTPLWGRLQAEP
jgi:hypothetical protein